ncbi:DP-EP family protein [Simiduia curdlanivorans]|uniref:DP-EP family protein n=1 Tax=Simiduia curdlanivorans TaxID=1492769 RepID=A0ABV8V5H6_9GAMM|nr:DP-EP family protein [Simiduia curdlanivorans]MDN3640281.1 DP-EP family protein [Simiduia curdlanivorans]
MSTINVSVTVSLSGGFTYAGPGVGVDGSIDVTEASSLVYTLQNAEQMVFMHPLLSVTSPSSSTPLDITNVVFTNGGKTMTLTDVDSHTETICMQLQVQLSDGSVITSPDPKIRDTKPQ